MYLLFVMSLLPLIIRGEDAAPMFNKSQLVPPSHKPFGMRLFLSRDDPNELILYWNCRGLPPTDSMDRMVFFARTSVNISTTGSTGPPEVRWANEAKVNSTWLSDHNNSYYQFNTTLNLDSSAGLKKPQLSYSVSCYNQTSPKYKVHYKYWSDTDDSQQDIWTMAAAGSVGSFLTVNHTLNALENLAKKVNNVVWVLPGGVLTDVPTPENQAEAVDDWLLWLQIVDRVTCCVPLVVAPSHPDLVRNDDQILNLFHYFLPQPTENDGNENLDSHWYSFDHRNMHVVVACAHCDLNITSPQYRWLHRDLAAASTRPGIHWTTLVGHETQHVTHDRSREVLEELLDHYNVDFAIWSHERWYERSQPMRLDTVIKPSSSNTLINVNGTIHFTCGTGGSPLQTYDMDKYTDSAHHDDSHFGVCVLERNHYNQFNTLFHYAKINDTESGEYELVSRDSIQIRKETIKPEDYTDGHFARFMKIFGIVLVGGASVMILLTLVVKIVQERDPSFIPNKIRNIPLWIKFHRDPRNQGEQIELEDPDPNHADMVNEDGYDGDKVMLLEEDEESLQRQAELQSTQLIHSQIR